MLDVLFWLDADLSVHLKAESVTESQDMPDWGPLFLPH